MRPESGLPPRDKRGGVADTPVGRQSPARPIPTRVGVRKPASATLPPALSPKGIEFRWKLVWEEDVKRLLPVSRPEPVVRTSPAESPALDIPRFTMVAGTHEAAPETAPRSKLTTLALTVDAAEEAPSGDSADLTLNLSATTSGSPAWLKWLLIAVVIAGSLGGYMYFTAGGSAGAGKQASRGRRTSGAMLPVGAPIPMAPTGWRGAPAEDATGLNAGRRFSLYRTAAPMTDYIVEFQGRVITNSLGWIVRAADAKNYYALRLELAKTGPAQAAELVRFAVVNGEQGAEKRLAVPVVIKNKTVKVRVDVAGPRITTYVEGRAVDFWNDTRLQSGTFGFMNDREGRAEIKSVRVSSPGSRAGN